LLVMDMPSQRIAFTDLKQWARCLAARLS